MSFSMDISYDIDNRPGTIIRKLRLLGPHVREKRPTSALITYLANDVDFLLKILGPEN